ncbi:MAG: ABC transporter ATP-binding protein [Thermotogae bacterium]|uniref:ATP-binding cassette domain-containing protein n=1 Tax=Kosmotoga arenicorallina TaxID=688066 RepID=A0A7C5HRU2_9BACT|nr:ATP-binding cassette domain-containing protein [Kosmotoga sp.]MBO8165646.1 ATP-binding cassette domain-containing protein [Kosmotoga sp.]RKX50844.1 MAG: ABC transporter ATP-binding protein [Thermotogota bacterium]HHF08327.1 ATP-binding cassette domain-containing protein [Kosmotoga arenicorallina]
MSDAVLEARKVVHSYGQVNVLRGLDFTVDSPEICGIFGKSGSGKSTLIAILAGLMKPVSGDIFVDSNKVYESFRSMLSMRKRMGIVFQLRNLLKELTVEDNLKVASLARGQEIKSEEINELLSTMGISQLIYRYPSELSVGEQQRVAIVRALVGKPKIVFADEPTGSVDEDNKKGILRLFRKITERRVPIVLTSHDAETLNICDKVFELKNGLLKEVLIT